jgi:hypothetical protein
MSYSPYSLPAVSHTATSFSAVPSTSLPRAAAKPKLFGSVLLLLVSLPFHFYCFFSLNAAPTIHVTVPMLIVLLYSPQLPMHMRKVENTAILAVMPWFISSLFLSLLWSVKVMGNPLWFPLLALWFTLQYLGICGVWKSSSLLSVFSLIKAKSPDTAYDHTSPHLSVAPSSPIIGTSTSSFNYIAQPYHGSSAQVHATVPLPPLYSEVVPDLEYHRSQVLRQDKSGKS